MLLASYFRPPVGFSAVAITVSQIVLELVRLELDTALPIPKPSPVL